MRVADLGAGFDLEVLGLLLSAAEHLDDDVVSRLVLLQGLVSTKSTSAKSTDTRAEGTERAMRPSDQVKLLSF